MSNGKNGSHWDGCWKARHDCAIAEIERLQTQLKYEQLIPRVVEVAKSHGYAIAIHGSLKRDCDLIACPWICDASEPDALIQALCEAVGGVLRDPKDRPAGEQRDPCPKPHGRLAWSIHIGSGRYFDVSVMPKSQDAEQIVVLRDLLEKAEAELERLL